MILKIKTQGHRDAIAYDSTKTFDQVLYCLEIEVQPSVLS